MDCLDCCTRGLIGVCIRTLEMCKSSPDLLVVRKFSLVVKCTSSVGS